MNYKTILITGAAGFIGYSLSIRLLKKYPSKKIIGIDCINDYYDPRIKQKRLAILKKFRNFSFYKVDITNYKKLEEVFKKENINTVVHLAAQAGVRFSLSNPEVYVNSNIMGTLNIFELTRLLGIKRVLYASSSSVYGKSDRDIFTESDRTDTPISMYAVTKKSCELMAYSYRHLYNLETIGLRFFTVYGPWGRPDMALFKFTKAIHEGKTVTLFNNGSMKRSFTYIDDITMGIENILFSKKLPNFIYNLGGKEAVPLKKFVEKIEKNLGKKALIKFAPLQAGDVTETLANNMQAGHDVGYVPQVSVDEGVKHFVAWYLQEERWLKMLKEPKQ